MRKLGLSVIAVALTAAMVGCAAESLGVVIAEQQNLTASDSATGSCFGKKVSVSGGIASIGTPHAANYTGSVYVFKHDGLDWIEIQKLTASDIEPRDAFGYSVSISGSIALTGAPNDGASVGPAYIFSLDKIIRWASLQ